MNPTIASTSADYTASSQVAHWAKRTLEATAFAALQQPCTGYGRLKGSKQEVRLMCSACNGRSGDFCVLRSATCFGGPWEKPISVKISDPRRGARWEDPFLWQDNRGYWHTLAHAFTNVKCAGHQVTPDCNVISGHLFSRDGLTDWTTSTTEPYRFKIQYDDGTTCLLATRERPKLLFDSDGEPTHIYNGVAPMPAGGCSVCMHSRKGHA